MIVVSEVTVAAVSLNAFNMRENAVFEASYRDRGFVIRGHDWDDEQVLSTSYGNTKRAPLRRGPLCGPQGTCPLIQLGTLASRPDCPVGIERRRLA